MAVLLSLKSFFSSNKVLAAAFSLLLVVCLIGGLFGVNYVFCNVELYNRYYSAQNTITVTNRGLDTKAPIEKFLSCHAGRFSCVEGSFTQNSDGTESTICALIYAVEGFGTAFIERGRFFTDEEFSSGAKKMILHSSDVSLIGTSVRIQEEDFEVIGLGGENTIPFSALSNSATIEKITFQTFEPFSKKERESLKSEMGENFFGMQVDLPEGDTQSIFDYAPMLLPTLILILLGFLNLSFLYIYFLKMRKRQYSVFRIGGASAFKIFLICLAEIFVLFSAAFVLSLIFYKIIMTAFFSAPQSIITIAATELFIRDFMNPLRLLIVYLSVTAFFILCFLPTLIYTLKKDISVRGGDFS